MYFQELGKLCYNRAICQAFAISQGHFKFLVNIPAALAGKRKEEHAQEKDHLNHLKRLKGIQHFYTKPNNFFAS